MAVIKPQLIKKTLQQQKAGSKDAIPEEKDLHIQATPLFGNTYSSHNVKTLKAVHTHFAKAKRKGMVEDARGASVVTDTLSGDELRQAMEQAKSSFQTMKEVQQQLNAAYKELLHLNSKS